MTNENDKLQIKTNKKVATLHALVDYQISKMTWQDEG